jgi:mannose-1-phosphate guanylyltransferase
MQNQHANSSAYALVLAGGGGTRLWPASRRARPKQLLTLGGPESLLAACLRRAWGVFGKDHTIIVTAADQVEATVRLFPDLGPQHFVVEPAARNTAAAIGLGAAQIARRATEDTPIAVLPADAHVGNEVEFANVVSCAAAAAAGGIVTIGIRPSKPETGFGYLKVGTAIGDGLFLVEKFVEKPDPVRAEQYLASGQYLWNSGMFFFTVGRFFAEARASLPELGSLLDEIRTSSDPDSVVKARYSSMPAISVDYGIMERATGIRVVPAEFDWNDLGSWAALADIRGKDESGNVVAGDVLALDARGNVVVSDEHAPFVGLVGVEDLVVVATKDAVLVTRKDRAQDVRSIVEGLKANGRSELL